MSIEKIVTHDKEVKKLTEKERKKNVADALAFSKEKKKLVAQLEKKKELEFLKSLIERWQLDVKSAEIIMNTEGLESAEISQIFDKIDEIETVKKVDNILPREMRLTKEEYAEALNDQTARQKALAKLDAALQYLYDSSHADSFSPASIFFSAFMMLNKNLKIVQENTIDIKRSLSGSKE